MNPLALELNQAICAQNTNAYEMLSDLGKALFFPKGILSQSAEAKAKATRLNATIGMAREGGEAMYLPSVMEVLPGLTAEEAVAYAPATGLPDLREKWREHQMAQNPALAGKAVSLPVVTAGLTHGLSLAGDLFVNAGDVLALPDKIWGNYRLLFELQRGAVIRQYPLFSGGGFNTGGFAETIERLCEERDKIVVLLNFPNNPTGYSPTVHEAKEIVASLVGAAEGGTNVVAVTDDAYFGLFYEQATAKESLFAQLAGSHPKLLAVKLDGPTKEHYVWGMRVGFITLSVGGVDEGSPLFRALDRKLAGAIRSRVSNCSRLSQTVVLKALQSDTLREERAQKFQVMADRAGKVREVVCRPQYADAWEPYPFNSGYFMCIRLKSADAEAVRVHMLEEHGIGLIAIGDRDLRVAFSCLEVGQVEELFERLYQGIMELNSDASGG